jgi:hypothetical protein
MNKAIQAPHNVTAADCIALSLAHEGTFIATVEADFDDHLAAGLARASSSVEYDRRSAAVEFGGETDDGSGCSWCVRLTGCPEPGHCDDLDARGCR